MLCENGCGSFKYFSLTSSTCTFLKLFKSTFPYPYSSIGKESTYDAGDPGSIPGSRRSTGEGIGDPRQYSWDSLVAHLVKNASAMRETLVRSLDWGSPQPGISPGKERGNPLQYSGLENSVYCIVHRVAKS